MYDDYRCPNCGALMPVAEGNMYDTVETYYNCTVQVLKNTLTGEISVGWWQEDPPFEDGDVPGGR